MPKIPETSGAHRGLSAPCKVVRLGDYGQRRERQEFDRLVAEALEELLAVDAGDLDGIYGAHRAVGRAVRLLLEHRWDVA